MAREALQFEDRQKANRSAEVVRATLDSGQEMTQDIRLYLTYKLEERAEALARAETSAQGSEPSVSAYQATRQERQ